jgi:tetratricopeptide (TPR) repeat protein
MRPLEHALAALAVGFALLSPAQAASPSEQLTARAGAKLERGDVKGALADANLAILRDSRNSPAQAVRGSIRMATGDRAGALADFSRSIELTPDHKAMAIVYTHRAHLHWQDGNALAAAADVAKALALDDSLAIAYNARARLKADAGDIDGAKIDYDRAIALDSKMIPAYAGRAAVHLQAGRLEESISDYKTLLWILPGNADIVASHAIVRGLMGETEEALRDLVRARRISPESVSDSRRGASPGGLLEQYAQMNPNDGRARLMQAVVGFLNGKNERAESDLRRAVELAPALEKDAALIRSRR